MRKRKMADGGSLDFSSLGMLLSQITDAAGQQQNGTQTNVSATAGGALKGAGVGAQIGSIVPGLGTAIGGGVGAIIGGISALRRNKKTLEEFSKLKLKEGESKSRMLNQAEDAKILNYDQGEEYQSFYAKGGKLPFQLLDKGVVKVKGKKHEQGGVKIGKVEVEKGEVIHGDKVFSDRLKVPGTKRTYADEAQRITQSPMYKTLGRNIRGLAKGDSNLRTGVYHSGTIVRNLQKVVNPLESLFNLQQQHNMASRGYTKKLALGGTLGDPENPFVTGINIAKKYVKRRYDMLDKARNTGKNQEMDERALLTEDQSANVGQSPVPRVTSGYVAPNTFGYKPALAGATAGIVPKQKPTTSSFTGKEILNKAGELVPFADNIVNAILTQKSPQVPVPTLEVAPTLKTKFNINPQLSEIARSNNAAVKTLTNNVADGASLRGSLLAQNINNITAKNQLLGQKENVETDLKNKQAVVNADTANRNASTMNGYDLRKFGRNADKQTRISQNVANLVEDVQQKQIDKKLAVNDETNLALVLKKYEKSGVLNRMQLSKILANVRKGMKAEDAIKN